MLVKGRMLSLGLLHIFLKIGMVVWEKKLYNGYGKYYCYFCRLRF